MEVEGCCMFEMCKVNVSGLKVKLFISSKPVVSLKSHLALCIELGLEWSPVVIHDLIWKL